ncbi:DoxX family protein [Pedobacter ginsengisoli]|uniref:DoxX family protein n=1 Tax=Pedobacter ginsengisoli TaxID=363852 RepID=UPI00254BD999|nr:DoxX family protein [Pedobacter ginsengisoli]
MTSKGLAHSWAKLSKGTPTGLEKLVTKLDVLFPHVMTWATSIIEVLGGLFIVIGLSVAITAIQLICVMLAAMVAILIHYGFNSVKTIGLSPEGPLFGPPGYEINLLYIAGLISLMCTGCGCLFSRKGL